MKLKKMMHSELLNIAEKYLEECGCCSCYHYPWFEGDCRDDANRFGSPEDLVALWMGSPHLMVAAERAKDLLGRNKTTLPGDEIVTIWNKLFDAILHAINKARGEG